MLVRARATRKEGPTLCRCIQHQLVCAHGAKQKEHRFRSEKCVWGNDFPVWAADYSLFFATAQNVVVQECASKHEEQEEQENATSFSVVALSFSSQTTLFSPCSLPSRCLLAAFSVTLFFYVCYHHPSSPKHLCYFNPTHTRAQTYKRSTRWA